MTKIFISQPMKNKTTEEIFKERSKIIDFLNKEYGEKEIQVIDSILKDDSNSVWCLGKSIQLMSEADVVVFCYGWDRARGCKIEHKICKEYGIEFAYITDEMNLELQ